MAARSATAPETTSGTEVAGDGIAFGQIVRICAALATAGAGVLHLDAAGDHTDHEHIAAFFVGVAVVQILWAATAVRRDVDRRVFALGLLFNLGVLAVWIVSRTVGLPTWIPDASGVEEIGWKDTAASGLAFAALAAGGLALSMPASAAAAVLAPRSGERILKAMAVATLAVTVPGTLAAHTHDHEHAPGEEAAHDHVDGELASAVEVHTHEDGAEHAHDDSTPHVDAEIIQGDGHPPGTAAHQHTTTAAAPVVGGHTHDPGVPAHPHGDAAVSAASLPAMDPLNGPGEITTVRLGPFALLPDLDAPPPHFGPAVPMIAAGQTNLLPLIGVPPPCQDCFVLGLQPDLVYLDGTPANLDTGPMLHHAVWTDTSRTDPVCSANSLVGKLGHRVFASGNERTGFAAPEGFGMPVGRGLWGGAVELMNTSSQVKMVYIQLTSRWVPSSTPDIEPVTSVWLDIDSCGDSEVDIPAGVTDIPWEWRSSVTGRILGAGGHLHDGGVWLGLTNQTTGEHVCTSVAGYGTNPSYVGSVESMSTCAWDRLATVRKGDLLRLNAHYNTAAPAVGVMGIMVILVHETTDLASGSASPYPATVPTDGSAMSGGHSH